jgi:PCI domain-containing protein
MATCTICNSKDVEHKCSKCGGNFCYNHTGSTDELFCKKHPKLRLNRTQANKRSNRCQILEFSRCPTCGVDLEAATTQDGHYYLKCIKGNWNSRINSPKIIVNSEKALQKEAHKYGLTRSGDVCHDKLKKEKGNNFCLTCLMNTINNQSETKFNSLFKEFGLNGKDAEHILKDLVADNSIKGILDDNNDVFINFSSNDEAQLGAELQSQGFLDLKKMETDLKIDKKSATRIIIEIIRKNSLRGTFTRKRDKYYLESGLTNLIIQELKNQGMIRHHDMARKYDIPEGNIKNYIMNMMKSKIISAFFADTGKITIAIEELENRIENFCQKNGNFMVTSLASNLKVAPELARKKLFGLIQKGVVRGIFTQNHEFITEEKLSEKIKAIARAYRTISLKDLARKLAITEQRVEEGLATLISRGSVAGYINMEKRQFIADEKQPTSQFGAPPGAYGATNPSSPGGQSGPKTTGEIEVVRHYDFVGGQLHFKVVVRNKSNMAIHDIKVILDVPSSYRRARELITISVIDPGNTHGVDFYLEPAECGISTIGGTVLYKDAMGKFNTIYINSKDVQIKCPLVIKTLDSIEDCQKAIQSLPSDARAFLISDLPLEMAYSAAHRAVSQFDTRNVASFEDRNEGYFEAEAWFSSEAKVTGGRVITRIYLNGANSTLEVRVWCNEAGQLTGFLAKIIELLFVEINLMRHIKAEERNKTINAMAITRNIMEISDICMLRYKASSARLKLEDTHTRISKLNIDFQGVGQRIYDWIKKLEEYDEEAMLVDEDADKLEKDIQSIHQILDKHFS